MQTHLWCARCSSIMEVELQIKKMRGRSKLAQLLSVCTKCHSALHTQTTGQEAAEEAMNKFAELKGAQAQASSEAQDDGASDDDESDE